MLVDVQAAQLASARLACGRACCCDHIEVCQRCGQSASCVCVAVVAGAAAAAAVAVAVLCTFLALRACATMLAYSRAHVIERFYTGL